VSEGIVQRNVVRIDDPRVEVGMHALHRVRALVKPGNWAETDPFLLLMEDWFPRGTFGPHPHRGIETVTYVLEGEVEHRDSRGHTGSIRPGEAQWMTAGRGLLHSEAPPEGVLAHCLQLWVNLPADLKMTEPRYQDLTAATLPVRREPGAEITVFSGASGEVRAETLNHVPVTMLRVRLEPEASTALALPSDQRAFLVTLSGEGRVAGDDEDTPVRAGQVAWLSDTPSASGSEVGVHASSDGPFEIILFGGRPLGEPVVARGPFVMNTEAQIREAYRDFMAGRFGTLDDS